VAKGYTMVPHFFPFVVCGYRASLFCGFMAVKEDEHPPWVRGHIFQFLDDGIGWVPAFAHLFEIRYLAMCSLNFLDWPLQNGVVFNWD